MKLNDAFALTIHFVIVTKESPSRLTKLMNSKAQLLADDRSATYVVHAQNEITSTFSLCE